MSDELDYRWRKVSEWGQPDAGTCPWGYRWRNNEASTSYGGTVDPFDPDERISHDAFGRGWGNHIEWQPLPPPVDEVMPPPEPERRNGDIVAAGRGTSTDPHRYAIFRGGVWIEYLDGLGSSSSADRFPRDTPFRAIRKDGPEAAILNAYDRGETVGRVRDWQEAPDDDTAVLRWDGSEWVLSTGQYVRRFELPWMAQPTPPEEVEE